MSMLRQFLDIETAVEQATVRYERQVRFEP
jgi:hypothetical protein